MHNDLTLVIVKLFPEMIVKGRSVRLQQIRQLKKNILTVLRPIDAAVKVDYYWHKLEVWFSPEKHKHCIAKLQDVPGIHSLLKVKTFDLDLDAPLESIQQQAAPLCVPRIEGKRFAVRMKRSGKHAFTSVEAERSLGGYLLQHSTHASVDLKQPEVIINIEVHDQHVHLIEATWKGMGGFPLGTQSPVLSLLSGGFDSGVAAHACIRRGCRSHFIFFDFGSIAHQLGVQQLAYYLWRRFQSSHDAQLIIISLEVLVKALAERSNQSLNGVLLKRAMLNIATKVADSLDAGALVMGDSIAQVSSQTVRNLQIIDRATEAVILRPLITTDKQDIIDQAIKIGTADFAKSMPEYCGAIASSATVSANLADILKAESLLGDEWQRAAIDSLQRMKTSKIIESVNQKAPIQVIHSKSDYEIIDVRYANLTTDKDADRHIPFHDLNQAFPKLDQTKHYGLFCDKGVLSQLHAAYLHEKGYNNVVVYRPR